MTRLLQSSALIAVLAALTVLRRASAMPVGVLSFADLGWWLRSTSPEDAVVACLRVIALGCIAWLVAGSLLYALARLSRAPAAIRAVEWSLPPALRGVIDRGLAAVLAGSAAIAAPAAAIEPPPAWPLPPVIEPREESASALPGPAATGPVQMGEAPLRPSPAKGSPAIAPGPGPMILPAAPAHAEPGTAASDAGARGFGLLEVSPGDSLWSIAAAAAARELGRPASEIHPEQVRRRWLRLIADNRAHLRSGDPDLIFPGEQVRLRAADDGPRVRRRTADDGSQPRRRADASESSRTPTSTAPAATRSAPAAHSDGLEATPAAGSPAARQAVPYALPVDRALLSRELMSRPHHDYPAWDLPLPVGTEVSAVHGGRVVAVTSSASRCGNGAVIDGHDGHRYTYCHADRVMLAAGEQVSAGQVILLSGSTGNSTGPHLHLGIATPSGRAICPQPLLQAWHDGSQAAPSELTTTDCV